MVELNQCLITNKRIDYSQRVEECFLKEKINFLYNGNNR